MVRDLRYQRADQCTTLQNFKELNFKFLVKNHVPLRKVFSNPVTIILKLVRKILAVSKVPKNHDMLSCATLFYTRYFLREVNFVVCLPTVEYSSLKTSSGLKEQCIQLDDQQKINCENPFILAFHEIYVS